MDIIDKLNDRRVVDHSMVYVEMAESVLDEAIAEIRRLRASIESLRAVTGAVDAGPSFREIRNSFADSDVLGKFNSAK